MCVCMYVSVCVVYVQIAGCLKASAVACVDQKSMSNFFNHYTCYFLETEILINLNINGSDCD